MNDNPDHDCGLPVIGRCQACGRGFVILPDRRPWVDDYARGDPIDPDAPPCGGEIVATCSNCGETLHTGEAIQPDGRGGFRHPSKCGKELDDLKIRRLKQDQEIDNGDPRA